MWWWTPDDPSRPAARPCSGDRLVIREAPRRPNEKLFIVPWLAAGITSGSGARRSAPKTTSNYSSATLDVAVGHPRPADARYDAPLGLDYFRSSPPAPAFLRKWVLFGHQARGGGELEAIQALAGQGHA